jgi:hypothetical protein
MVKRYTKSRQLEQLKSGWSILLPFSLIITVDFLNYVCPFILLKIIIYFIIICFITK